MPDERCLEGWQIHGLWGIFAPLAEDGEPRFPTMDAGLPFGDYALVVSMAKLVLRFPDVESLEREHSVNLSHGRAFVPEFVEVEPLESCDLVLVHPESGDELNLSARAVMVAKEGATRGTGLQLTDEDYESRLLDFVRREEPGNAGNVPRNVHERVRKLPMAKQLQLARRGELQERTVLERLLGKQVWDALLRNPRITVPEVARIARKGTAPRTLLEQILLNTTWVRSSTVRRALLSNPRVGDDGAKRVLRLTPKNELQQIERSPIYPMSVRTAARALLRRK